VFSYYNYVEDGEDQEQWVLNDSKTPEQHKKEQQEQLEFQKRHNLFKPTAMLDALQYYKPKKIDTRLESILEFYCYKRNLVDVPINQFSKNFIDKVIWNCIDYGYNNARIKGKYIIERYTTETLQRVVKMLRAFGRFLEDNGYKINSDYKKFELTRGGDESHIKYKWNDKNNIYTLYKSEFDEIRNHNFSNLTNKKYRNSLIQTRDLFLMQTYAGGLRVNELYRIQSTNFIELNGKKILTLKAGKTSKPINNPVSDKFEDLLKVYNYEIPIFNNDNTYNDNLKLMAKEIGLSREILQYENYAHYEEPKPYKVILHEVFSTKLTRKALVSILYNMGEKKEVIATITNHSGETINYYIALEEDNKKQMLDKI